MVFRVEVTARGSHDLSCLYDRISVASSPQAMNWFNGLEDAILSLERLPRRCPLCFESKKQKRSLRHLLYGNKPDVYRIIFEINERLKIVNVLSIRHAAMDDFYAFAHFE